MVESSNLEEVVTKLEEAKTSQNMYGEVKWQKVTANYLEKYKSLMDIFFSLMKFGKIKSRIMFTSNQVVPVGLSREQIDKEYFLLYYQFIKHAFGLKMAPTHNPGASLRINFDKLPDKKNRIVEFKQFIFRLNGDFNGINITLPYDNISEVDSHDHVVLQCIDIVTGAMSFRLNEKHLVKPTGQFRRGKKTVAKEQLYKHINRSIIDLYDGFKFNVGISTGKKDGQMSPWSMPYRHWRFMPKDREIVCKK